MMISMAWTTILALCLIARAHGLSVSRRTALAGLSSLGASPFAARAAEQQMRTSSDVSSLSELSGTGARSANLGASTIAGKSRPVTGCVLLDSVSSSGPDATPTLTAELVLDGGVAATATFESRMGPVARGFYYDVEARNSKLGDSAFVQVASLPAGGGADDADALAAVPASFFTRALFRPDGRFGAFGAPTDVRVVSDQFSSADGRRTLELSFAALSPGGNEVPRRALVAAVAPPASGDAVMLVVGATAGRWRSSGADAAAAATSASFRVKNVRSTKLRRERSADFRFEEQGGLREDAASERFVDKSISGPVELR